VPFPLNTCHPQQFTAIALEFASAHPPTTGTLDLPTQSQRKKKLFHRRLACPTAYSHSCHSPVRGGGRLIMTPRFDVPFDAQQAHPPFFTPKLQGQPKYAAHHQFIHPI